MSNGSAAQQPNLFTLQGGTVTVSYSTTSIAGVPQLSYQDPSFDVSRSGDGIVRETTAIGTLVTILAVTLELAAAPPWWLHLLLWPPITAIAVAGSLRVAKAWLLGVEYRREAREGRRTDRA